MGIKRPFGTGGSGGGGYENLDPDYNDTRISKLAADYRSLEPHWQATFMSGLSKYERAKLMQWLKDFPVER